MKYFKFLNVLFTILSTFSKNDLTENPNPTYVIQYLKYIKICLSSVCCNGMSHAGLV